VEKAGEHVPVSDQFNVRHGRWTFPYQLMIEFSSDRKAMRISGRDSGRSNCRMNTPAAIKPEASATVRLAIISDSSFFEIIVVR
jgi:hypothetical protein